MEAEVVIQESDQTELIPKGKLEVVDLFVEGKGFDALINAIRDAAYSAGQDVSDKDGRENVKSTAYKIARSKTFLDNLGKDVVASEKKRVDAANATRKKIRDTLDGIREDYRKPLTDWEDEEKRKIQEEAEKLKKEVEKRIELLAEVRVTLPWNEIAAMSATEFINLLEEEKAKLEAEERAKEERDRKAKEEAEAIEKEKAKLREQRKEIRIFEMKKLGFKFENDFFTIVIAGTPNYVTLDEVLDQFPHEFEMYINQWRDYIDQHHIIESFNVEDSAPGLEDDQTMELPSIDVHIDTSGSMTTTHKPPVQSHEDSDIDSINQWLDSIGHAIEMNMPVAFNTASGNSMAIEIKDAFNQFIQKIRDNWILKF